jgi:hypothetical protein
MSQWDPQSLSDSIYFNHGLTKNVLRARNLDTLEPEAWLNDQVIDVMTQVLASRANTESTREVAVFDTQFTKLILERPRGSEAEYYVYDRVVGYTEKRLLGKSPTKFDCLLFPNGINRNHWTIMAVFPKQRMIVCLDSLFDGKIKDARTIFRWLYDEIRYNHPEDEKTVFQPFQQDLGWKYTTDKLLKVQNDMNNCGVILVGFIHCLLFGINLRHLTHALMAEYRKRIFDELHGAKVKVYRPTPWIQYNPVTRVQKSLLPLPDAVSRSIINKRRGTRILNFAEFKKVSEELRTGRAAEQKKKKEARVLKLAADAKAQGILDEY